LERKKLSRANAKNEAVKDKGSQKGNLYMGLKKALQKTNK